MHDCRNFWLQEVEALSAALTPHSPGAARYMFLETHQSLVAALDAVETALGGAKTVPQPWIRVVSDDPMVRYTADALVNWLGQDRNDPAGPPDQHTAGANGWLMTGVRDAGCETELVSVRGKIKNALGS